MGVPSNVPPGPDCVAEIEWLNVAAGLLPEVKTRELMKHAAQCGHCGPLLKNAAETLSDEVTPSEETLLASLSSARPEWQRNMAATLRGNVQVRAAEDLLWWRAMFAWPTPAYAFAGIAAVAVVAWIGVRDIASAVRRTIARAGLHRASNAGSENPWREIRSHAKQSEGQGRRISTSHHLCLKAEALIGENLSKNPNDPAWLQARARADLLDGNYESAIKSLQQALETQPDSPGLLTDLGIRLFSARRIRRPTD